MTFKTLFNITAQWLIHT